MSGAKRGNSHPHACAYLLDQEVKVLGELGSEACISKISLSVLF